MKLRFGRRSVVASIVTCLAVFLSATVLFAQDSDSSGALPALFAGGMLLFILIFAAAIYVYISLALFTIANKTRTENAWLAWIPLINILLMLMIAKKPLWWFVLFLIPVVNIVMSVIVWMGVAEARNKPNWWGILTIVPMVNIIVPGYLAWAD